MGAMTSYPRAGDGHAQGFLAEPSIPDAPGVVVIQEWWGLQGQIRSVCDRLAAEGFRAMAPDLFEGKVIPYHDTGAAKAAMSALDLGAVTDTTVRGAVRHLARRGHKVGIVGFCMGGAVAVTGAARVPELAAAVCFYGLPPRDVATPGDIRVPFQGHFASKDSWCTPQVVAAFEEELRAAGGTFELHRYEASHAFMNPERPEAYDASAARLGWDRCLAFLRRHLAAR
jgi:carboxymethylenebutenolidase